MPKVTAIYGEKVKTVEAPAGSLLGDVIATTELPLEQPCAGRGTCGKCKVLVEAGLAPPDEIEQKHLTPGERAVGNRLACRARIQEDDVQVTLAPIVVYSNKIFRASTAYKRSKEPLGLAIDLGSTTVAAFVTMLESGEVGDGRAALNQQSTYGADVISRLAAAVRHPDDGRRLHNLALASINQAVDALQLSRRVQERVERVVIVGNVAMHHLLVELPLHTIARKPFQPYQKESIRDAAALMGGIFREGVQVMLPPLIGGFVGSDALACLAYFDFDNPPGPIAAVDLGTNGEVMVTDGRRIVTASTAAGPAFEGVNISCGTRAINGAIVDVQLNNGDFSFKTIADEPPVGLTGSGLLSAVYQLRQADVIDLTGRFVDSPPIFTDRLYKPDHGMRRLWLTPDQRLALTQGDIRELQKAKGAIRVAIDILLAELGLQPGDLKQLILTGSFGGQVDIDAVLALGMIPPVPRDVVKTIANGAGLGAASFLTDEGFAHGERIAAQAEQVDLDLVPDFTDRYVNATVLAPDGAWV
jgi:uncharacterized 2Fe-2S/4Fe-4S cluster protein (DUF4445 family)